MTELDDSTSEERGADDVSDGRVDELDAAESTGDARVADDDPTSAEADAGGADTGQQTSGRSNRRPRVLMACAVVLALVGLAVLVWPSTDNTPRLEGRWAFKDGTSITIEPAADGHYVGYYDEVAKTCLGSLNESHPALIAEKQEPGEPYVAWVPVTATSGDVVRYLLYVDDSSLIAAPANIEGFILQGASCWPMGEAQMTRKGAA